jgi:hypothetical protein
VKSIGVSAEFVRNVNCFVSAVVNVPTGPLSGKSPFASASREYVPKKEAAANWAWGSPLSKSCAIAGATAFVPIFRSAAAVATSKPGTPA